MYQSGQPNPFVARFSPPSSYDSAGQIVGSSSTEHALGLPQAIPTSTTTGQAKPAQSLQHFLPLSPPDTNASPYLVAATDTKPADLEHLSLPACAGNASKKPSGAIPLSEHALAGLEQSAHITPAMLVRDHLPRLMLGNGPLAFRHIVACLTQTVPGFSHIQRLKAKKVVTAALEGRKRCHKGSIVEFHRVGRERWLATTSAEGMPLIRSPRNEESGSCTFSRSSSAFPTSPPTAPYRNAWASASTQSRDHVFDDLSMSLDDDDSVSDAETEVEDWESMGPEALYNSAPNRQVAGSGRINYNLLAESSAAAYQRRYSRSRRHSRPTVPKSTMMPTDGLRMLANSALADDFHAEKPSCAAKSPQEQEAAETLLNMGSL